MPLDEDIWNDGKFESRMKPEIIHFLKESNLAYHSGEIIKYLTTNFKDEWWHGSSRDDTVFITRSALRDLVNAGNIEGSVNLTRGRCRLKYGSSRDCRIY